MKLVLVLLAGACYGACVTIELIAMQINAPWGGLGVPFAGMGFLLQMIALRVRA